MKGDFRRYWNEPSYYRHLARKYRAVLKIAGVLAVFAVVAAFGFALAGSLNEPETFTVERLVTVTRKVNGKIVTQVLRTTETLTEEGKTQMVTVVRNGQTITIPARTITKTDTFVRTVDGKEVTVTTTRTQTLPQSTRTDTQTETTTVDRPTTVTQTQTVTHQETGDPGVITETVTQTETETNNVPGPTTTVTETQTNTVTDTVTNTVTETVTEPAP